MSDTKHVRELLLETISMLRKVIRMVRTAEAETHRKSSGMPRAPVTSRKMTPELAAQLVAYKRAHPKMANRDIGRKFGVDGGRVSAEVRKANGAGT